MKTTLLLSFWLLGLTDTVAQKTTFSADLKLLYSDRILTHLNRLTEENASYLKELEVLTPGVGIEFSLAKNVDAKHFYQYGLGYTRLRYGSKWFLWPEGKPNTTPQATRIKDAVVINQATFHISRYAEVKQQSKLRQFWLLKASLLYNFSYVVRRIGGGFVSGAHSDNFPLQDIDFSLGTGYAWWWKISKKATITATPFLSIHATPYRTRELKYRYLPIDQPTSGILWSIGLASGVNF